MHRALGGDRAQLLDLLVVKLPKELPEEQREKLMQIAAKCPVHRTLEGEVMFDERLEIR